MEGDRHMELYVENLATAKGVIQACQLKWTNSWLFVVDAPKGSIVCGSFDIAALNGFGLPAAQIVPAPGNPAYNVSQFLERRITHVNALAAAAGVKVGMSVQEAAEAMS
jgi:uncharacterized protein YunC (DUF1805 family)